MSSAQNTGRARWRLTRCGTLIVHFLIYLSLPVIVQAAGVSNETVRQEGNRFVFEYDLDSSGPADVTVNVTYGGKEHPGKDLHLEGDVGKVSPGKGKRIFWNVLRDLPRGLSGEFEYEIVAGVGISLKKKEPTQANKRAMKFTGTIENIEEGYFTIMGKKGSVTLKAGDKVKLEGFKVGDQVIVQYRGETASYLKMVRRPLKTR